MASSTPEQQIAFVQRVAVSDKDRAAFIANPTAFAKKNKIVLDPAFAKKIASNLAKVEKDRLKVEGVAGGIKNPGQPKMNAVVAAAAVVTAASAVVTAVSATYTATKWKGGFQAGGLLITPTQIGKINAGKINAGKIRGRGR
jgi:hypothetical protein